jgi:DNA-binding LacI/PurR family transcriptional regulator
LISQSETLWSEGQCPQLRQLIEQKDTPTAIFASNDLKAVQVMRILRDYGLNVPSDISVVGYDDVYLLSGANPRLTTVHQPLDLMVEAGAKLLLDILAGKGAEPGERVFEPSLVVRESTGPVVSASEPHQMEGATK